MRPPDSQELSSASINDLCCLWIDTLIWTRGHCHRKGSISFRHSQLCGSHQENDTLKFLSLENPQSWTEAGWSWGFRENSFLLFSLKHSLIYQQSMPWTSIIYIVLLNSIQIIASWLHSYKIKGNNDNKGFGFHQKKAILVSFTFFET